MPRRRFSTPAGHFPHRLQHEDALDHTLMRARSAEGWMLLERSDDFYLRECAIVKASMGLLRTSVLSKASVESEANASTDVTTPQR